MITMLVKARAITSHGRLRRPGQEIARLAGGGAVGTDGGAAGMAVWLLTVIDSFAQRAGSRRELGRLTDGLLKDIGISRADVWRESRKPFWRD